MANADTTSAGEYLNKLLSTSGNPNSEVQILDTKYILKYDEYGMPGSVISEGKTLSISEFLDSDDVANYLGIKNGEGSKSYIPKGKSNLVPENFNGEVFVSSCFDPAKCKLTPDGGPDFLQDIPSLAGGAFDRDYNGISGSVPSSDPLTSSDYDLKNLTLASSVWGVSEVGQKLCKPSSGKFPNSAANWWFVLKNYIQAEKFRNQIHSERVKELQDKVASQTGPENSQSSQNYQLDAMVSQIELYNLEIDSISGSGLYSDGQLAQKNREMSRIAWRETILGSVYQGIVDSKKEDEIVLKAYNKCLSNVDQSLSIAKETCEKSQLICNTKKEQGENVNDIVECDEAKYACEMKDQNLPLFKKVALNDLVTLYTGAPIPSNVLNEKFNNVFHYMNYEVNVFFPKSKQKKYGDWIEPLNACLSPLKDAILANGLICPSSVADTDYDKDKFIGIGRNNDLIGGMNHYTVGEKAETSAPSYANSNNVYKEAMKLFKSQNPSSTEEEQKNAGLRALWLAWINSAYSKNFLADRPIREGVDPKAEEAYAKKVMEENNLTSPVCSSSSCIPAVVVANPNQIELESPLKITESAKNFLASMGVVGDDTTVKFLEKNWNLSDMYLGQSHMRQVYFKAHLDLLTKLIESDRFKLSSLLVERQKLVDAYNKLKKVLENSSRNSPTIELGGGQNGTSSKETKVKSAAQLNIKNSESGNVAINSNRNNEIKNSNFSGSSSSVFLASNGLLTVNRKSSNVNASKNTTSASNVGNNNSSSSFSVSANAKISKLNKKENLNSLKFNRPFSSKNISEEPSLEARSISYEKKLVAINNPAILKSNFAKSILENESTNLNQSDEEFNFKLPTNKNQKVSSTSSNFNLGNLNQPKSNSISKSSLSSKTASNTDNSDQKKINDAIDAKKFDSSKTERSNFDSLFEQITKAYIRNYEKVK